MQGIQNRVAADGFGVEAGGAQGVSQVGVIKDGADDDRHGGGLGLAA